ncbi:unnamed protein product [Clonostachys rosea f. rosea IK726]|uniref:Uncharacterized protein n=1 Tax=Clonostachys rosea f. rosea IK726 TaxID=1349383 RepID=A0ACA9UUT0_BIOOC|nr:unnamed protein product [Clonostachys rosea f. rosea IK726]
MPPKRTVNQQHQARRTSRRTAARQYSPSNIEDNQQDSPSLPPPPSPSSHRDSQKTQGRGRGLGRGRGQAHSTQQPPAAATTTPISSSPAAASASQQRPSSDSRDTASDTDMASIAAQNDPLRSSDLVAPEISYHVPQRLPQQMTSPFSSALVRPHGPPPPVQQPPSASRRRHPRSLHPEYRPRTPLHNLLLLLLRTTPSAAAGRQPRGQTATSIKSCWATSASEHGTPATTARSCSATRPRRAPKPASGGGKDDKAAKKDRDHTPPMLNRLYVCRAASSTRGRLSPGGATARCVRSVVRCLGARYTPTRAGGGPGSCRRAARRLWGPRGGAGDGGVRYVEETVQDEGEWSIWEVDGEVDRLFCQNLSLFAKLFLDNKSVFFDVGAFNYFLLVYTPPPPPNPHPIPNDPNSAPEPRPQITGLFSKEKLSWDNNNLACILVFPPWQRKGLGALLMGASYEISRREGLLGGPEKPISDLGKKGYMRFWAGEIARWLLSLKVDQGPDHDGGPRETIVDIKECSEATWIAPDDCLFVLRDMGIVEDAGVGPGKPEKTAADEAGEEGEEKQSDQHNGQGSAAEKPEVKLVPRVRVDKAAVRRYVATHRLSLEKVCDPDGFVEGYAMKPESGAGVREEQTDGGSDE